MRAILLFSIFLLACNPVKIVLNNKEKFDIVAEEVIRRGYCVNDTIVKTEFKDSVVYKDVPVYLIDSVPCKDFDTTIGRSRIKVSSGVLQFTTKDSIIYRERKTIQSVRDKSLENLLKMDIYKRDTAILNHLNRVKELTLQNESLLYDIRVLKIKMYLIIGIALIVIFRKPIMKLLFI